MSTPTLAFIGESDIEMVPHPPYSPNLALVDYFLFPHMKKQLRGRHFPNLETLQAEVRRVLHQMDPQLFLKAMMDLPVWWKKCVLKDRDYFEGDDLGVHYETVEMEDSESEAEQD